MSDELSCDISKLCANVFVNCSTTTERNIVINHHNELEQIEVWDEIKLQMENELTHRKTSHRYTQKDAEAIDKCYQNFKMLSLSQMLIGIRTI